MAAYIVIRVARHDLIGSADLMRAGITSPNVHFNEAAETPSLESEGATGHHHPRCRTLTTQQGLTGA
jgi:hypothetical protein